jgi:hypothetical protein
MNSINENTRRCQCYDIVTTGPFFLMFQQQKADFQLSGSVTRSSP